jgi:hypothetical protein
MQASFDVWRAVNATPVSGDPPVGIGIVDASMLRGYRQPTVGAAPPSARSKFGDLASVLDAMGHASAKVPMTYFGVGSVTIRTFGSVLSWAVS